MAPRKTRTVLQLVQEPPKHSMFLKKSVVLVNTHEAQRLCSLNPPAEVLATFEGHEGQRFQLYLYGMKLYAWIAGISTESHKDDFPMKPEESTEIPMNPMPSA